MIHGDRTVEELQYANGVILIYMRVRDYRKGSVFINSSIKRELTIIVALNATKTSVLEHTDRMNMDTARKNAEVNIAYMEGWIEKESTQNMASRIVRALDQISRERAT